MKACVIFYSLSGNTEFIAEKIAAELNADLFQLKPVRDINPRGFSKFFQAGKQALFKSAPELKPLNLDLDQYELVVIGTPVWAGSYTPAIRTFLNDNSIRDRKIALFCCHGGGGQARTFNRIKKALPENDYLPFCEFKDPLKNSRDQPEKKAAEWVQSLKQKLEK